MTTRVPWRRAVRVLGASELATPVIGALSSVLGTAPSTVRQRGDWSQGASAWGQTAGRQQGCGLRLLSAASPACWHLLGSRLQMTFFFFFAKSWCFLKGRETRGFSKDWAHLRLSAVPWISVPGEDPALVREGFLSLTWP